MADLQIVTSHRSEIVENPWSDVDAWRTDGVEQDTRVNPVEKNGVFWGEDGQNEMQVQPNGQDQDTQGKNFEGVRTDIEATDRVFSEPETKTVELHSFEQEHSANTPNTVPDNVEIESEDVSHALRKQDFTGPDLPQISDNNEKCHSEDTADGDFGDFDDFEEFKEPDHETERISTLDAKSMHLTKSVYQLINEIFGDYKVTHLPYKPAGGLTSILDIPPRSDSTSQWSARKLYNQFQRPTRQFLSVPDEAQVLKWSGSAVEKEVIRILTQWKDLRYKKLQIRSFGRKTGYVTPRSSPPGSPETQPGSPNVSGFPEINKPATAEAPRQSKEPTAGTDLSSTLSRGSHRPPALIISNKPSRPIAFSPQTPKDLFTVLPIRQTGKALISSAPDPPLTIHPPSDRQSIRSPSVSPPLITVAQKSLPHISDPTGPTTIHVESPVMSVKSPTQVVFGPVALSTKQEMESDEAVVKRIVSSLPDLSFMTR